MRAPQTRSCQRRPGPVLILTGAAIGSVRACSLGGRQTNRRRRLEGAYDKTSPPVQPPGGPCHEVSELVTEPVALPRLDAGTSALVYSSMEPR